MYVIFINDAVIYLIDKLDEKSKKVTYNYNEINLDAILNKLITQKLKLVYLYHNDLDFLWRNFKNYFKIIEAAGGLVFNEKNETLWIYRNDKWDLPKGKIEKGETKKIAAVREVQEECGISNVHLKKYLNTTYHIYQHKKDDILKITYWYKMQTSSKQTLIPQLAEGITKVEWIDDSCLKNMIKNTYDNIKLLMLPYFIN